MLTKTVRNVLMPCSDISNFLENNRFLIYCVSWSLSSDGFMSLLLADPCMMNIVQNETSFLAEPFGSWNKKMQNYTLVRVKNAKCTRDEILNLSKHKCTSSLKIHRLSISLARKHKHEGPNFTSTWIEWLSSHTAVSQKSRVPRKLFIPKWTCIFSQGQQHKVGHKWSHTST